MQRLFIIERVGDIQDIQARLGKVLGKKVILSTTLTALTLIKQNNINQVIVSENIDSSFIYQIIDCCPECRIIVIIDSSKGVSYGSK